MIQLSQCVAVLWQVGFLDPAFVEQEVPLAGVPILWIRMACWKPSESRRRQDGFPASAGVFLLGLKRPILCVSYTNEQRRSDA